MKDRWALVPASSRERRESIGGFLAWQFRQDAAEDGVRAVASRLRRYKVPLPIALRILGILPSRHP